MMKLIRIFICLTVSGIFFSCGDREKSETAEEVVDVEKPPKESTIQFHQQTGGDTYPDAMLEMFSPLGHDNFPEGKVPFEFNIKNYPFAEGLKGFQLQLIINGKNPVGYNMPIFQKELNEGTYKALAFLVDDNGFALKEFGNYVSRDFTVGESRPFPETEEPSLFVNLPVDGQEYSPGKAVWVDFIVIDGDLEDQGLAVEVSVNDSQFLAQEMSPLKISGMPSGSYEIKIALVNTEGEELSGPFAVSRKKIIIE